MTPYTNMELRIIEFFMPAVLLYVWFIQESKGCDERIWVESGQTLEIKSPDYPDNTFRRMHCFYDLTTRYNSGDVIHMTVLDTELSCLDENISLFVFDAFSASAQYLGRVCKGGNRTFVSPKDRLYLVYQIGRFPGSAFTPPPPLHLVQSSSAADPYTTTDNSTGSEIVGESGRTFRLQLEGVPEFSQCYGYKAKVLTAEPKPQQFVTPYFPIDVAPNVHCRWLIKAPEGLRVELEIANVSMRGSNDCKNFGLYLYDGKTTYDDVKLAVICDNQSDSQLTRRYHSSGNFLLVVFSSSSHVLHSGGGVKILYSSVSFDPETGTEDRSLLYFLVGSFITLACLTAFLALLRYVIIPVRQKKSARRLDILAMSRESGISDLPPPYTPTDLTPDTHRMENTYTSAFLPPPAFSELPYRHDDIQARENSTYSDGAQTFSPNVNRDFHRSTAATISQPALVVENEYQELPFMAPQNLQENNQTEVRIRYDTVSDGVVNSIFDGGDEVYLERDGKGGNIGEGRRLTATVGRSRDRNSFSRDSEGMRADSALTRNRLAVPGYHQARFSSDSGFTEGEDGGVDGNEIIDEESDSHYQQLTELNSGGLSYREDDLDDIYANTSSMVNAVFKSLNLVRDSGQDTSYAVSSEQDQTMSSIGDVPANTSQAREYGAEGFTQYHQHQDEVFTDLEDSYEEDNNINVKYAGDDLIYSNESNAGNFQEEHQQKQHSPQSHPHLNHRPKYQSKSVFPSHQAVKKTIDNEVDDNRYEVPLPLIQSGLTVSKDAVDETYENDGQIKKTNVGSETKTSNPHNTHSTELGDYDHLVSEDIGAEGVEYQVLDI